MEFKSSDDFLKNESFVNYCLGIDQQDIDFWKNYAVQHPEQMEHMNQAADLLKDLQLLLVAEKLKPEAVSNLRAHLKPKRRKYTIFPWKYTAAAAAVLFLLASAVFLFYPSHPIPNPPELAKYSTHQYVYEAGVNERKSINLWDGSFVILDKGAKLVIDSSFGQSDRKMYLSGIAYFKVAKDKQHPFKVYTGKYVTTAVGTAFKLQTDQTLKKLKVELEEGKVIVEKKNGNSWNLVATLHPKESISLDDQIHLPVHQKFYDKDFNQWKIQEVVFQNAPMKEVLLQLEIYYNVKITVEDSVVMRETFNGKFRHDALPSVMEMVCFSLNKQFKFIDSNHIIIY
jgi:transmembrane sensor